MDSSAITPVIDPQRWVALGAIVMATLMVVLDASVINIALPQAQRQLGIIDANRHWAITAYAVAFGGLLLLGGRVADYAGRKRTMIVSLLGFAVASTIGGLAITQWMLFAARALQGVFAVGLAPAALALVSVSFTEPRERATAFGIYGAVSGAGGAIGLIIGGLLTEYGNWRLCMFVNVPIAVVAALATVRSVRDCVAWIGERLQPDHLVLPLREADVLGTPEFQHPVQCVYGDGDLGCSTPIGAGS